MKELLQPRNGDGCLHRFAQLAELDPEAPFLRIGSEKVNRADFLQHVALWSGALQNCGVGEGDFVALISPNCLNWCFAFWAIVNLGATPVPLDPQIGAWELGNLVALIQFKLCISVTRFRSADVMSNLLHAVKSLDSSPALICLDGHVDGTMDCQTLLRDATPLALATRNVAPTDWLMLAATSGTTGNPKVIVVPHLGFLQAQCDMASALEFAPSDRILLGMPLYHQGGFGMGLQALVSGAEAQYEAGFEPERFLQAMQDHRVTVVQLSPTLAKLLLSHPRFDDFDLSELTLVYFAGEVLPDSVAAQFWRDRRTRVVNVIGSSETATMVMWDSARDSARSASEYCALPFTRIRVGNVTAAPSSVTEPGTLWVSTDALLVQYFGNTTETARRIVDVDAVRWFDTEDLVQPLSDGYIRFIGRVKRVIKRGPNLVHPEEVEAFLLTNPHIAAVAVTGEAHELFTESIVAWVQPAPHVVVERGDLMEFCRGNIAAYKIPDRFIVVEQLPIGVGKVAYKAIRTGQEAS